MYSLPTLGYEYGALAPSISADVMKIHHAKHHQTYVDKLNTALDGIDAPKPSLEGLLAHLDQLPQGVREAVRNNGGGHYNHSLFWESMSPSGGGAPSGELAMRLNELYGSFQQFVDTFSEHATGVFGSGWVWLQPDFEIITTANQDNPLMTGAEAPILGLDVWEHAYYLDYQNVRADYIKAWWDVVDWEKVGARISHQ